MKHNHSGVTQAVLVPLRSAWEDTVAAGLRQATDVELLWMLDEIEAQLGEREAAWNSGRLPAGEFRETPEEIPDWDNKTPEELEAIARDLEAASEVEEFRPAGTGRNLHRPEKFHPLRRPGRAFASAEKTNLRCEELEPRYPPSAVMALRVHVNLAPAFRSSWSEDVYPAATPAARDYAVLCDEDAVDHLTSALVA